eukprot:TRINITY_DN15841_c0_g1_i1.p1 TRINITY_DN15841_c0_g1~~TRINITY_DN15841_c0_g1_i1.p1  ORF type:complete len:199 (+),score=21.75 TRINITY_DN15841_c0_g1_i1:63-599(+)
MANTSNTHPLPKMIDPEEWFELSKDSYQPQVHEQTYEPDDDSFITELNCMIDLALSKSTYVTQSQVAIIADPLAIHQEETLQHTEAGSIRSTQAATESLAALTKLCNCSVAEALFAQHVCSGNAFRAKQLLEGKGGKPWTEEEDKLICSRSIHSYSNLLEHRSAREIQKRMHYYKMIF